MLACQKEDPRISLVVLSRNFGKDAALAAGLAQAKGKAAIPIDVDLQDSPFVIPEMVAKWRDGAQIVNARRIDRKSDTAFKRNTATLYYKVFNLLAEHPFPANVGDFRLLDRKVLDVVNAFTEKSRINKDLFSWVGFKTAEVTFERRLRHNGSTKWSFWKLWNFGLDGLFGASTVPLRAWSYIGFLLALSTFVYAGLLIIRVLLFWHRYTRLCIDRGDHPVLWRAEYAVGGHLGRICRPHLPRGARAAALYRPERARRKGRAVEWIALSIRECQSLKTSIGGSPPAG